MSPVEFVVTCPDYTKTFATREAAERWVAQVETLAGKHPAGCRHVHAITDESELCEADFDPDAMFR